MFRYTSNQKSSKHVPRIPMKLNFNQLFRRLLSEEAATTTVEYALLIALILVFCLATLLSTGDVQEALWFQTADRIQIIAQ